MIRAGFNSTILPDYQIGFATPHGDKATEPRNVTATDINTTTESNWFYPDIAAGSTVTVGTDDEYTLNGTDWLDTEIASWVEGTRIKLRTDSSGTYSTAETPSTADATLLDDGVIVATFVVTSPLEPASISNRYTNTDHYTNVEHYT